MPRRPYSATVESSNTERPTMAISPSRRVALAVLTTALLSTGITASVAATIPNQAAIAASRDATSDPPKYLAGTQCVVRVDDGKTSVVWLPGLPTPR